jgi:hypothetical protein
MDQVQFQYDAEIESTILGKNKNPSDVFKVTVLHNNHQYIGKTTCDRMEVGDFIDLHDESTNETIRVYFG